MKVDAVKRAFELRKTLRENNKVLVVDFSDTLQGKDTSKVIELMPKVSTGEFVFRTKVNVKSIDPLAAPTYHLEFKDIRKMSDSEIEDLVKREEFDFPLWFKHTPGFEMKKILDYNPPFVLQVAGCNFHDGTEAGGCWYCFVDDKSNDGRITNGKTLLGISDTIDSMLEARKKLNSIYLPLGFDLNIKVLRISGGEPTIVLDYVLDVWREIGKRGLDIVGQLDSNLSTGSIVKRFEKEGIFEKNILEKLADYPVKILTAVKGTDEESLKRNVQANTTMEEQFYSIKRFVQAGFDIYPQIYNPNPETLWKYLESMDRRIENFSLRAHIGPLKVYGPTEQRLKLEANRLGIPGEEFIKKKKEEWDSNYKHSCEIMDSYLQEYYGVGYREVVRADVPLRLNESRLKSLFKKA